MRHDLGVFNLIKPQRNLFRALGGGVSDGALSPAGLVSVGFEALD